MKAVVVSRGPDVQLLGSAALVQGRAAVDAYRVVSEGLSLIRRRDGLEPSDGLLEFLAALKVASGVALARSDIADTTDVRDRPTSASSCMAGRRVGVGEVARLLGIGHRQARRLAPSLGGSKKRSGEWVFDLAVVNAYIDQQGEA